MYMQKKPGQEFYYLSGQGSEDILFLKIFDSKTKGIKAPCEFFIKCQIEFPSTDPGIVCPHSSFKIPYNQEGGKPRQSIEVRCLVFSSKEGNIPLGYHEQVKKESGKFTEANTETDLNSH